MIANNFDTKYKGQGAWKLADAKNKLSEVVEKALREGPQTILRRGEKVIVLDEKSYLKLRGKKQSFVSFLAEGPSFEGVRFERDRSAMRGVKL